MQKTIRRGTPSSRLYSWATGAIGAASIFAGAASASASQTDGRYWLAVDDEDRINEVKFGITTEDSNHFFGLTFFCSFHGDIHAVVDIPGEVEIGSPATIDFIAAETVVEVTVIARPEDDFHVDPHGVIHDENARRVLALLAYSGVLSVVGVDGEWRMPLEGARDAMRSFQASCDPENAKEAIAAAHAEWEAAEWEDDPNWEWIEEWRAGTREGSTYLRYGEHTTGEGMIFSLSCEHGSGVLGGWFHFDVHEVPGALLDEQGFRKTLEGQQMTMMVDNSSITFDDVTLQPEYLYGGYEILWSMDHDPVFFAMLRAGQSLFVEVEGIRDRPVPLDGADEAVQAFLSECSA